MRRIRSVLLVSVIATSLMIPWGGQAAGAKVDISPYQIAPEAQRRLTNLWVEQLQSKYPPGTWAPMRAELTDEMLDLMGLPPREVLSNMKFPTPTIVDRSGRTARVSVKELARQGFAKQARSGGNGKGGRGGGTPTDFGPNLVTVAGAGWFGIRPGSMLLLMSGGGIGLCSMAHVYGSAGAYDISTAGHCGKTGEVGTVIAAFGNNSSIAGPVLLDFGTFAQSQDGGLGRDWALIDIYSRYQHLVTPTMAFWGGPRGMYRKTGALVTVTVIQGNRIAPGVSVTPDPFLAQTIVHYGHGAGIGTGGTPRAGEAIHWGSTHYMFFGAISPGDSGSGANTLAGDAVGANMQAAGIMTHLWIDLLLRQGLGIMGGTRATQVSGTLANGQIVPYPVPLPGAP
ncbi:MAG: hypothetical protein ACRD1T_10835 [Acidimicrobiia bacterium]